MKVLIAVDDTEGSKSILSVFKTLVRTPDDVILVNVQRLEGRSLMIDMLSDSEIATLKESLRGTEHKEALDRKAESILSFYKRELEKTGQSGVKTVMRDGLPAQEILKVAAEENVGLIIMGCNGKTGMQKLLSGCVTKEVERNALVPVLVAKTSGCDKKEYAVGWRGAYAVQ